MLLICIFIGIFKYSESKRYKNIAYIKLPGKESYMKEYKYYDTSECGSMITIVFTDGTKVTTSTKNVALIKRRKSNK